MGRKRSDSSGEGERPGIRLTRRQMLTATGAAALGASPLAAVLIGRAVRFRQVGVGRAFFDLNGRLGWAIDTSWFDGRPALAIEQSAERMRIALTGAFFPGTDLAADFVAEILPGHSEESLTANLNNALLNLQLAFGNLTLTGLPLGAWLAGEATARAPVTISGSCKLAGDCGLTAAGRAIASFAPDWTLRLQGGGVATLQADGHALAGDSLAVQALPRRQAQLALDRGSQIWPALLPVGRAPGGSLAATAGAYDRAVLALEANRSSLTFEGSRSGALAFIPSAGLTGANGAPLRFPLAEPRYTIAYEGDRVTRSLTAQLADRPVWVQARGAVLQLGRTDATPAFTWTEGDNEVATLTFRPALLAVAVSAMDGLIIHPAVANPAAAVSLAGDGPGLAIDLSGVEVVRPADLLSLTFAFTNMELRVRPDKMPYLHPTGATGQIAVTFPPQHIAEEAVPVFDVSVPPLPEPSPPIAARAAGPSTLLFETSADVDFTLDSLLSWDRFTVPAGGNGSLEAPYKLFYQLPAAAAWAHSTGPVTGGKWTELWHTRAAAMLRMRATTNTNYGTMGAPTFETSPSPLDRADIQSQSATTPIDVSNLMLSSLGAWMKANGSWGETAALQSYFHQMAMGRDSKVVVIRPGHLMPFGHKATLVVVTERKFRKGRAYLHRKKFIVVREPVKRYGLTGSPNEEREFPFREVEITSRVTPPLDSAPVEDGYFWIRVAGTEYPFQVVGRDWKGQSSEFIAKLIFVGIRNGEPTNSTNTNAAKAAYESAAATLRQSQLQGQTVAYAEPAPDVITDLTTARDATTALDTGLMQFAVGADLAVWPFFRPKLAHAMVRVPALEQFVAEGQLIKITLHNLYVANQFNPPNKWEVFARLAAEWMPEMPASGTGGVATPQVRFKALSRRFGAIGLDPVTGNEPYSPASYFGPAAKIIGVLKFGDMLKDQTVDAINAAAAVGKKIIPTFHVGFEQNEDEVTDESKSYGDPDRTVKWTKALQLRLGLDLDITGAAGVKDIPNFLETNYHIGIPDDPNPARRVTRPTALKLGASVMRILKAYPTPAKVLQLLAKQGKKDPGPQQLKKWHYQVTGSLEWFALKLYFLKIHFEKIGFKYDTSAAQKLSPVIKLDPHFSPLPEGPLTFIAMFLGKTPNEVGGATPPPVEENVIQLSLSVRIPDFSSPPSPLVGPKPVPRWEVSALEPWFKVKFYLDNKPIRFALGISYREAPFKVIYWLKPQFGLIGMGFFMIEFEPGKVRAIAVLLEAGAILSIEKALKIGILKGEIRATVGFYFELAVDDQNRTSYEVTGFLRIVGTVGIKIFEVSLEIYLGLTYKYPAVGDDYWVGTAKITIKIKLWLLSFSWSYTYTKRLSGSKGGGDTAYELPEARPVAAVGSLNPRNVNAYCAAFCHSYATERLV